MSLKPTRYPRQGRDELAFEVEGTSLPAARPIAHAQVFIDDVGSPMGVSGNPLAAELHDAAGDPIGVAANPLSAVISAPIAAELQDAAGDPIGVAANPAISSPAVRSQKGTVTVPAATAWVVAEVTSLGVKGRLNRLVIRAPASSTWTAGAYKVIAGDYTTATDPDTVPDEDVVIQDPAIAVTGSATVADVDEDALSHAYDASAGKLLIALQSTAGTAQVDVTWSLVASDVQEA